MEIKSMHEVSLRDSFSEKNNRQHFTGFLFKYWALLKKQFLEKIQFLASK